jgi:hypothetical protein
MCTYNVGYGRLPYLTAPLEEPRASKRYACGAHAATTHTATHVTIQTHGLGLPHSKFPAINVTVSLDIAQHRSAL